MNYREEIQEFAYSW